MKIEEKLMRVRTNMVLPKIEYNQEHGYAFRNAESMLAVIKPMCEKEGLTLWFTEDVVNVGTHNYIKTTLTVLDTSDGESKSVTAVAREDDAQTMPSSSMISGATASYAHKYALQNMFAIDDGSMDPDAWGSNNRPPENYTPQSYENNSGAEDKRGDIPIAQPSQVTNQQSIPMQPLMQSTPVQQASIPRSASPVQASAPRNIQPAPAPMPNQDNGSMLWQNLGPAPVPMQQNIPMQQMQSVPAPQAPCLERAMVLATSYEPEVGRAKIMPEKGMIYYRTFDERLPQGPWSSDNVDLSRIDLNKLYEDASASVKMPLKEYTGLIRP